MTGISQQPVLNAELQRQWRAWIADGRYPLAALHQDLQHHFPEQCGRSHWRSRLKTWLEFDAEAGASEAALTAGARAFFEFIESALQKLARLNQPSCSALSAGATAPSTAHVADFSVARYAGKKRALRECAPSPSSSSSGSAGALFKAARREAVHAQELESQESGSDESDALSQSSSSDSSASGIEDSAERTDCCVPLPPAVEEEDAHLLQRALQDMHRHAERCRALQAWKDGLAAYYAQTLEGEQAVIQNIQYVQQRAKDLDDRRLQLSMAREEQELHVKELNEQCIQFDLRQQLVEKKHAELRTRVNELDKQDRALERQLDAAYRRQCLLALQRLNEEALDLVDAAEQAKDEKHEKDEKAPEQKEQQQEERARTSRALEELAQLDPRAEELYLHLETCFLRSSNAFFMEFAPRFLERNGYRRLWNWYRQAPRQMRELMPLAVSRLLGCAPDLCARAMWPDLVGPECGGSTSSSSSIRATKATDTRSASCK